MSGIVRRTSVLSTLVRTDGWWGPDGRRMSDVTGHLRMLRDVEEIKRLKARYFRLLDTKCWEEWGQVFAAGAVMDIPEADMVTTGRADIVRRVSAALEGTQTVHHGHMPEIDVTGPDTAIGTWAMFDYVEWDSVESSGRVGFTGYGHYLDAYIREDGAWRIARTRLERLRVDPFQ